ncbi:SDR family oxidoreductase [Phaeovibrio sulfidiphilus]|uniref:SDR family oxidoreductase n=1 Tax=Phaeovibrio sulfidiphilus TaxID=1220600 RepID=A0A8J7CVP4_9PROT|nr:SDR family oxidoreductase [Phaeovibrio sulfidiphilus]MBE1236541.1 SDR family oxidoreductase [Phaeovibrio sulfidiphilus]
MKKRLLCFGFGYTARHLARHLDADEWDVAGTTRTGLWAEGLSRYHPDVRILRLRGHDDSFLRDFQAVLEDCTHLLVTAPPDENGDPFLRDYASVLEKAPVDWIGYTSSTGVYGDTRGDWVDETSPCRPGSERAKLRLEAEDAWRAFGARTGMPVTVFRLSGIYGPGRCTVSDLLRIESAARGTPPVPIAKEGHVFSRIHVDDIARAVHASMDAPGAGGLYNLADDEPAPHADVVRYSYELLGMPAPETLEFEDASRTMSPMALSFWSECRRVRNDRMKSDLGAELLYPSYREGLAAVLEEQRLPEAE